MPLKQTHTYDDIIHLPRPVSHEHLPMSLQDRAAQFMPFAALVGYDAAVAETARLTDARVELTEGEKEVLNEQFQLLQAALGQHPKACFLVFVPDEFKQGGAYTRITGIVKKIDPVEQTVILEDRTEIPMDDIVSVNSLE